MWLWICLWAIKSSVWRFSTKNLRLTQNLLSTVAWPWNNFINILSPFHNIINLFISNKKLSNDGIKAISFLVKLDKGIVVVFHYNWEEIWKLKFCCITFATWQLFIRDKVSGIFLNISSQDLEDSTMKLGDKHIRHLANKDQNGLFPIAWLQRLAKNSNASYLNWKTGMLVTFLLPITFSICIL